MNATISADIVQSTSLYKEAVVALQEHLRIFIDTLESDMPGAWGRIVRGDSIECVLPNIKDSMRVALMLKCHVKAFGPESHSARMNALPHAKFRRYGVRIAIGVGPLRTNDNIHGIIDGKAIYRSGRALDGMSSRMRSNLVIVGPFKDRLRTIQVILNLSDELLSHATSKQCQVLYMRLRNLSENDISTALKITQQAVNSHLRKAGWYALENAIRTFEEVI